MAERDSDAFELALRALGRKERTEAELLALLRESGVEESEIERVIGWLIESGAIDDERFARRFAEDKRELAAWGPERVRDALRARGVPAQLAEAAAAGDDDQLARATGLIEGRGLRCDSERERQRALAFLARRGYSLEMAYEAVRRIEREAA